VIATITQLSYLAAATLFIFSLRWLSRPNTARRGVFAGVLGLVTLATCALVLQVRVRRPENG